MIYVCQQEKDLFNNDLLTALIKTSLKHLTCAIKWQKVIFIDLIVAEETFDLPVRMSYPCNRK